MERLKKCNKCGDDKPLSEFNKNTSAADGYEYHCRECEKRKKASVRYGVSPNEYDKMFNEQQGHCLICETPMGTPYIDHCHNSFGVRGMLCNSCNLIIGHANDDVNVLKNAIEYLENRNGRN